MLALCLRVAVALALVAAAAGCPGGPPVTPCRTMADCPAGFRCSSAVRYCIAVDAGEALDAATTDRRPDGSSADGPVTDRIDDDTGRDATGVDSGLAQANVVFVTSQLYAPFELQGQDLADQACRTRAASAGLAGNFIAWLSTSTSNAIDRLEGARGWVRRDGRPFVDTVADLAAGRIAYPLRIDENGIDIAAGTVNYGPSVLTGTRGNGTAAATCEDWTASGSVQHTTGKAAGGSGAWTFHGSSACSDHGHLYCFQIDRNLPLDPYQQAGRLAYVSTTTMTPGGGVQAADAICTSDAQEAGRSGSFKALIADDGTSAASRHNASGAPWVRGDGVLVAASAADLLAGRWLAPIDHDAAGAQAYTGAVWTGASAVDQPGTTSSTCAGWTSTTVYGGCAGICGVSNSGALDVGPWPCSPAYRLYCLQQ